MYNVGFMQVAAAYVIMATLRLTQTKNACLTRNKQKILSFTSAHQLLLQDAIAVIKVVLYTVIHSGSISFIEQRCCYISVLVLTI